jgi:hypothetical protein
VTGRAHGTASRRRNRFLALHANAGILLDTRKAPEITQQLHIDGVAGSEDPLFMALLAQIAFVGGTVKTGYYLPRSFLRGRCGLLPLSCQNLLVDGGLGAGAL